jgi:tetratricopeptide (TPR) repeat protein
MARLELSGFPEGDPNENYDAAALAPAIGLFNQALRLDPGNRTARHRYGLVAMAEGDFDTARLDLEQAYAADPGHRGVIKVLGYSYVWLGRIEESALLLSEIPEAKVELEGYAWWWGTKGRQDLVDRAAKAAALLTDLD